MKRIIVGLSIAAILVCPGYAQERPETETVTIEQIVSRYIEALGGLDAIRGVRSRKTIYTVHMQTAPPYAVELAVNRGGELKSGPLQGNRHFFYDGRKFWNVKGDARSEMSGPVAAQFKKKADLDGPLVDTLRKGITLRYLGEERIEFSSFLKLEVTWPDGVSHVMYFDRQSGLLRKTKTPSFAMVNGKIVKAADSITCFYDYREVNGIRVPFAWVQTTEDLQHIHLFTVQSVEIH